MSARIDGLLRGLVPIVGEEEFVEVGWTSDHVERIEFGSNAKYGGNSTAERQSDALPSGGDDLNALDRCEELRIDASSGRRTRWSEAPAGAAPRPCR